MAHKMKSRKHRASKRSSKRSHRHSRRHRATRRRRMNGGQAPLTYSLAGDWASKMSQAQGGDFFKYHAGQHGGAAPVSSIGMPMLSAGMAGPAMMSGLDAAIRETAGMRDPSPADAMPALPNQKVGGKRKGRKASRKASRKGRKGSKRRGGALGFAPVSAPGMLLSNAAYSQAGLNPDYVGAATEYAMAAVRDRA